MSKWTELAPRPEPLPAGKSWHVFLSYRSVHRPWVLQLYDALRNVGFSVYLDQFVLRASDNLVQALDRGLDESSSAILVWSAANEDSEWCKKEYYSLQSRELQGGFTYGVVKLGETTLPGFAAAKIYVDFPDPRLGPTGLPLLRLMWSVVGEPLSQEAVRFGVQMDEETRAARNAIHAANSAGNAERLMFLAGTDSEAWRSTPVLRAEVAECLIKLERFDQALAVLAAAEQEFPDALRPKQLKGLALARAGRTDEAQLVLGELEAAGSRDPETLGIYARTWMDRYKVTGNRLFLRKSRNLYQLAFEHTPSDSYVGINAASKSVMLGELEVGRDLAARVMALVGTKPVPGRYWDTATVAEVQLLGQNFAEAATIYQAAVDMAPMATGDHRSTRNQARELMKHLNPTDADRAAIEAVFAHLGD
jgi:tetratricopeptide (TPR) repeat protein